MTGEIYVVVPLVIDIILNKWHKGENYIINVYSVTQLEFICKRLKTVYVHGYIGLDSSVFCNIVGTFKRIGERLF